MSSAGLGSSDVVMFDNLAGGSGVKFRGSSLRLSFDARESTAPDLFPKRERFKESAKFADGYDDRRRANHVTVRRRG